MIRLYRTGQRAIRVRTSTLPGGLASVKRSCIALMRSAFGDEPSADACNYSLTGETAVAAYTVIVDIEGIAHV
jgi:hypothetical protein